MWPLCRDLRPAYVLIEAAMKQRTNPGKGALATGGLLLLCLLWAWASLRPDLLPASGHEPNVSPLLREAALLGMFAVLSGLATLLRRTQRPRGFTMTILVGLGLFVVPVLLITLGKDWIDDPTRVALFSLTPVFAIVFEPHINDLTPPERRGAFAAALAAVAGTLLVFPLDIPHSTAAGFAMCGVLVSAASIAAANCLGVRIASQQATGSAPSFAAIAAGFAAVCLGALDLAMRHFASALASLNPWDALDLVALALLFWLMPRMSAVRMTTRFLIAPLLANLIGIALLRPALQLRSWTGLLLIAIGSAWLLFAPEEDAAATSSSLGIH
jgi:drug/metabolite transporter (DMT)-like permease